MKTLMTHFGSVALLCLLVVSTEAQTEPNLAERLARKIEKKVSRVRGLTFQSPTKIAVYSRPELIAFVKREMVKEGSQKEARSEVLAHSLLNLMPADFDMQEAMTDMLGEQIGGFYDPEKKELVLVKVAGDDAKGHALHEVIMSHELVHALQDQYFDLSDLHNEDGADRDRKNAILSLIEGDATLAMMFFSMPGVDDPDQIRDMLRASVPMMPTTFAQLQQLAEMAQAMGQEMDMGDGLQMDSLAKAPAIMSDEMCFSYMGGLKFVFNLYGAKEGGGMTAIDAAFMNPPLSTEQILHPKKYTSKPDWPVSIALPNLSSLLPKGSRRTYSNNLGELHIRTFLAAHKLRRIGKIHAGWDGDKLELYETPTGPAIVWYSRWDSEEDAEQFEGALLKITQQWISPEDQPDAAQQALGQSRSTAGSIHVSRSGTDVVLLRGFAPKKRKDLIDAINKGLKVEQIQPWKRTLKHKTGDEKK